MRKSILLIFWGLIIVFFDFRINSFDLLMNPLGYILVASGLNDFSQNYQPAKTAKAFTYILVVVSIPQIIIDDATVISEYWNFYSSAVSILNIVLAYFIFLLLIELAQAYNQTELESRSKNTMKGYLITMILVTFVSTFAINFSSSLGLIIGLAIAGFIAQIVFIVLIFKFRNLDEHTDYEETHINTEG
ncbi:hypothetical protein [Aquisalibacillus elongatus]|uniref:Uncharacterized protein n=1 Tax=Aquisalibacillus elongatus TaxID=485577 RepID=A0A3N5C323_9BACI|nr:hypothetical protein [Aquisalibacillus elongatus]RPF50611.1 hypothetical protein EDC24_2579 [Aquisalibacillus elongatus]